MEPPKKLVVDANIVFSAISTRTFTFELIRLLHEKGVRLYSPQYIHEELVDKTPRLLEYSKLTGDELGLLLKVLFRQIDTVPKDEYSKHMPEAERQIKDHLEDVPYLALAIKLDCPIWSNEQRLGKLKDIKAIPTHKLKKLFEVE
ncbi:MAG: PIN domain-containing protein [Candidatus Altiarchaeia archaeon]